jgi:hypothetical protein
VASFGIRSVETSVLGTGVFVMDRREGGREGGREGFCFSGGEIFGFIARELINKVGFRKVSCEIWG